MMACFSHVDVHSCRRSTPIDGCLGSGTCPMHWSGRRRPWSAWAVTSFSAHTHHTICRFCRPVHVTTSELAKDRILFAFVIPCRQFQFHGLHESDRLPRVMCSANYGKMPVFDCSKAERELGIQWTSAKRSLQDMAAREIDLVSEPTLLPTIPLSVTLTSVPVTCV